MVRIWGGDQEDGIPFLSESKTYLFFKSSRTIPVFIQRVERKLSLGLKRPGRGAEHSLPRRSEVKNSLSCTSTYAFNGEGTAAMTIGVNRKVYLRKEK